MNRPQNKKRACILVSRKQALHFKRLARHSTPFSVVPRLPEFLFCIWDSTMETSPEQYRNTPSFLFCCHRQDSTPNGRIYPFRSHSITLSGSNHALRSTSGFCDRRFHQQEDLSLIFLGGPPFLAGGFLQVTD